MAFRVKKTEHNGPKKGRGFWGIKADAKHQSSRLRRHLAVEVINVSLAEYCGPRIEAYEKTVQEQDS